MIERPYRITCDGCRYAAIGETVKTFMHWSWQHTKGDAVVHACGPKCRGDGPSHRLGCAGYVSGRPCGGCAP